MSRGALESEVRQSIQDPGRTRSSGTPPAPLSVFLLRPAAGKLLAHAQRPAPHGDDLDSPLPDLAKRQLALDARLIELPQHAVDSLSGRRAPEVVSDRDPPMTIVTRVGLRV